MPGPPRTGESHRPPSRRAVLTVTYAAGLAVLGGCGVRLDLPTPPAPAATRRRVPDEDVVVAVVRRLQALTEAAAPLARGPAGGPVVRQLVAVMAGQLRTLRGRLTNDGVPEAVIEPTSPATPVLTSGAALATRLACLPSGYWTQVAGAAATSRTLLASATSAQLAGAVLLGQPLAMPAQPGVSRVALVERTAALRYGMEVVAAQSRDAQRERAMASLASLETLAGELGPGSPSAPAWALPFAVTTPAAAARLAAQLLRSAVASAMSAAGPAPNGATLAETAAWSARVQALATAWGVPLSTFPGSPPPSAP